MFKATFILGVALGAAALLAAYASSSERVSVPATEDSEAFAAVGSSGAKPAARTVATLPAFQFVDQRSQPFGRDSLLGQPTLVHFFFSTCNGPCPGVTSALGPLLKEFPELRIVSISIDPAHDTPEVLRAYADRLAAPEGRWLFLNGPQGQVLALAQIGFGFGIDAESKIHSTSAVLFDKNGSALGSFKPLERSSLAELKQVLAQH